MPAYDYRCRTCDVQFEVRRSIADASVAPESCPAGHTKTSRVFSAVAVGGGAAAPAGSTGAGGGCCGGGCCG